MIEKNEVIHDTGYGLILRSVMRNKGLSYQAKVIYSYLASFAGNTGKAFPSTDLMADELGMSRNTLFKYLKELKDTQVVKIEKERSKDGTFTKNIYYLNNTVGKKTPCTNLPYMDKPYTDKPYTDNQYTNSNNSNSNNFNSNKHNTLSSTQLKEKDTIIEKWNELGLHQVRTINTGTKRYKSLKARIDEYSLEEVLEAIDNIHNSSFLKGNNNRGWEITFDWFTKPNNFTKVLEGQYKDKEMNNNEKHRQNNGRNEKESVHNKIAKIKYGDSLPMQQM